MTRPIGATLAALVLATLCPAAARADSTIATPARPTPFAAGQGLLAYSSYDPSIGAYRLMIARGGTVRAAAVAPSESPFDVDVGPTENGRRYLVYSRCADRSGAVPRGCDVYGYDPDFEVENRYDASSSSTSEVQPTYWRGRVAFVRHYGDADDPRPVVYTRRAKSSRASDRLPGLPDRRCLERRGCGDVTGTIEELELYGEHLAQTARTTTDLDIDRRLTELRLVDVQSGRSEQIGARGIGEAGQMFIGPSFAAGKVHTYYTCRIDPGGCMHGIGGFYRYGYSTGDWAKAASTEQLAAFGVSADGIYTEPADAAAGCGRGGCAIVERVPPPDLRPTSRPPR